ncbi:MAG: patatin-like phospholipase family protein [Hahellaceae bacterium]|jgi:NTE family protein|nr:patatin-like phospholipase family protein [Hahellaceae bacterium]
MHKTKRAVVLTGGGARSAYQVGVLRAISDLAPDLSHPFDIICGTSAGAINALGIASGGDIFRHNIAKIESLWGNIKTEEIYRTDLWGMTRRLGHFTKSLMNAETSDHPASLLDNAPLRGFLDKHIDYKALNAAINLGHLHSVCITACGYKSGQSVNFFQAKEQVPGWHLGQRIGMATTLTTDHLLASSAIPMIFPPVKINREYFGDGVVRQMAPLSPAIHLGAKKILIVGVSANRVCPAQRRKTASFPSLSNVLEHVLNGAFIDVIEHDYDHALLINNLLKLIPDAELEKSNISLRPLELLEISPSEPIDDIANRHLSSLPKNIQRFVGKNDRNSESSSSLASYLLFEGIFCKELIRLGYQDAQAHANQIVSFLED